MKTDITSVTAARLLEHISVLSSDEFQGRAPGSSGEERTVEYLGRQCEAMGLLPAAPEGGYFQDVPVTGFTARPAIEITTPSESLNLSFPEDFVAMSRHEQPVMALEDSEIVFVGYGIVAPEYGWDDYKDVDIKGKTIVMLVGDPSRRDPLDSSRLDEKFFRGRAMTYYGRWTYKFEIASARGAAAVLIVHETEPAGYAYDVVKASWSQENFSIHTDENRVKVEGWISLQTAQRIFSLNDMDFYALKTQASSQAFTPVPLATRANIRITNTIRKFNSKNVIAKIEGHDPELKNECVIYSAHWDHFGTIEKDGIVGVFSGALDNASGVACVLEIAGLFSRLSQPPSRSVVFFLTTLEERGLLGAQHYVSHPAIPLERTLAVINLDVMNVWGRTREIVSIAHGHSSLDDVLTEQVKSQGRKVAGDPEPEKGYFFRSDHLEFIRRGVPALFFLNPGSDYLDQPADFGEEKRQQYLTQDYHKVTDKIKSDWDLSGTVEDTQLLFLTGLSVAQAEAYPVWRADFLKFKRPCPALIQEGSESTFL